MGSAVCQIIYEISQTNTILSASPTIIFMIYFLKLIHIYILFHLIRIIFTDFIQKSDHKTNLIINLSEDGWFGKSIGPYQHLSKAKFRAIENNTFVIRTANRGFSAFINNRGEIIKLLNPNESGNIEMKVAEEWLRKL